MAFSYDRFFTCVSDRWHLVIGDPNITGWAVFAAYALAFATAVIVLRRVAFNHPHRRQTQVLWGLIALLMAALAVNKQLDLQSLLTALGRCLAQEQGWYENRRIVQRDFVFGLIVLAAMTGVGMFWILRGTVRQNLLPLLGLVALAGFVLIRAGHFLHLFVPDQGDADALLHGLTTALEVLCPVLIITASWQHLQKHP